MLPSILVSQLQQGVEDFLRTTFPSSTPHFHGMLDRFFARDDGSIFKGPYVSVQLPFLHDDVGSDYFPEVPLEFPPYAHQAQAFERLSGADRRSMLVATGTGSGKTEAFLWPILDHVRRHQDERGIKAILIYPMNALANDQAGRIARAVHEIDALEGVRAGLYVGDEEDDPAINMGLDHVITSRETMRLDPPDVLLTNYKMLDYLLTRPRDARLWQHNEPETLQYLVVDELHTFDGAQGTDLACLIRRLKNRLGTPNNTLCCVGTSATLGGPDDIARLCRYAEDVFGEPFGDDAVIGEQRQSAEAFLEAVEHTTMPEEDRLSVMRADIYTAPEAYASAQVPLWFGDADIDVATEAGQKRLAELLRRHSMLHALLAALGEAPRPTGELIEVLSDRVPAFERGTEAYRRALLDSFLALLSWARVDVVTHAGDRVSTPFVQLRMQLWLRELRRMVARVDAQPRLAFSDDLQEGLRREHLPLVHCLECGAMGWVGTRHQNERRFSPELRGIYERFFNARPTFGFAFPETEEQDVEAEGTHHRLCGYDLHLSDPDATDCEACGRDDRLVPVFVPNNRTTTQSNRQIGTRHCPYCSATSSLTIVGSRAASLASVMISQLFASAHNDDKKLLTFSDSVQDAAHRAGFFEARTYRFNLRSAIQQFVERQDEPITLDELPDEVARYYMEAMGEKGYVSTFIAPDMQWFREFEYLQETGDFPSGSTLVDDVSRRVSWEVWSAYGFRARIGRTLEKTGSSVATLDSARLREAVERLTPELQNRVGNLRDVGPDEVRHFVRGIVAHLKNQGGIFHPELRTYIERGGDNYVLNRRNHLPNYGRFSRLPAFVAERGTNRFDPVLGRSRRTGRSWLEAWAIKCFCNHDPMLDGVLDVLYLTTLGALVEAELLGARQTRKGTKVWGIEPNALFVEPNVVQCRCRHCGHNVSVAERAVDDWEGVSCLRYQCRGRYARESQSRNYYRQLYRNGDIRRIVAREHTGLLERQDREALERAFERADHPWEPNLLSSTPTLEMGVDIGSLSTVMLCSVPPSPANYVQRIGRGGRRSGNAVDVTVANGRPHDLFFFEEPEEMIAGAIRAPGVFLGAAEVLFRQFVAYGFDRWVGSDISAEAVPARLSSVLRRLDDEDTFPDPWLRFVEARHTELFEDFVALFGEVLDEERTAALRRLVEREGGIRYRVMQGLYGMKKRRDDLQRRTRRLYRAIRDLEQDGPLKGEKERELEEMRREKTALQKIYKRIGDTNTYNFFTDAGLLPNYAFPETGVTLRSILYRSSDEGGDVWDREYVRPAPRAIRELAPGAAFYADGRRVTVDQVDLSGDDALEAWRLCGRCGHMDRVVEREEMPASCPRCGSPTWSDRGQERTLVRHDEVMATTADRRSRIDDASESRDREFFDTRLLASVRKEDIEEAYRIDSEELPFGFEFVREATFREVNFGRPDEPPLMEVGGQEVKGRGFQTCPACGRVAVGDDPIKHTRSCRHRGKNGGEPTPVDLFLYREVRSEAVRILLPETSFAGTPERVQSLKAAIQLGLEEAFEGSVAHLKTAIQEAPGDREIARRRYLVLYDSVPGGTGYLAELLRQEGKFMDVLEKALRAMETCPCREDPDKDGCYRCLYAYRNHYDMPHTSRSVAVELLREILKHRDALVAIDTVDDISVTGIIESELEARFLQRLRELDVGATRLEETMVRGNKPGYRLRIGDQRYDVEPQVEVGPAEDVMRSCSIDFVLRPLDADLRPIAVFLDGLQYHRNRIGRDLTQRRALLASEKYYVWSLTWRDVVASDGNGAQHARNYLNSPGQRFVQLVAAMGEERSQTVRRLVSEGSFDWLIRLLKVPDPSLWERIALAQALLFARRQDSRDAWLDAARQRLPETLVGILEDEANREGALLGLQDEGPDGAEDPVAIWAATTTEGVQAIGSGIEQARRSVTLALHLDDRKDRGRDFEAAWSGLLRLYNLFQFIPESYPVAESIDESWAYHELIGSTSTEISADGVGPAERSSDAAREEAWDVVLEHALEETRELLSRLRAAGVPAPETPFELQEEGTIIADAELGWPERSVAVVLPSQEERASQFENAGWRVFTLANVNKDLEPLVEAVQSGDARSATDADM